MKRTVCMLLVLALLAVNLPVGALAAETEPVILETVPSMVEESGEINTFNDTTADDELFDNLVGWGDGYYEFSNFTGLKELAALNFQSWTNAHYTGTEPLVIAEDISFNSEELQISFEEVIIPAGVTANFSVYVDVQSLTVEGTADFKSLNVNNALAVTGTLNNNGGIWLTSDVVLTGEENIRFTQHSYMEVTYQIEDMQTLKTVVAAANAESSSHKQYSLQLAGGLVISESITIPDNANMSSWSSLDTEVITVASGCTLTLECNYVNMGIPFVVEGALVNKSTVDIYPKMEGAWQNGKLTIAPGGSYSGNGTLRIWNVNEEDISTALIGLDLSLFDINKSPYMDCWLVRLYTDELVPDEYGEYHFTRFEQLQKLAQMSFDTWTNVYYDGTEPLVISEDMTLPANLALQVYNATIHVPAGVTLQVNNHLSIGTLTVDGTVQTQDLYVQEALTVNGVLFVTNYITVRSDAVLTGEENIVFSNSWITLNVEHYVGTAEELKAAIAAAANETAANKRHQIQLTAPVTLTESLEIPGNCYVNRNNWDGILTVASGCTLTVSTDGIMSTGLIVEGSLVNNGRIEIYVDCSMTVAAGGSYSGTGILSVFEREPSQAITGLDLTRFEITEHNDWTHYWEMRDISHLTKLGTPTELLWGYEVQYDWDPETQTSTTTRVPGRSSAVSWKTVRPDQNEVVIKVYRETGDRDELVNTWYSGYGNYDHPDYRVDNLAVGALDLESGDYYFTVQSMGDYTQYANSDIATSGIWSYVKPNAKVGTCTNLSWNWPEVSFDGPVNDPYLGGYHIEWFYFANENAEPIPAAGLYTYYMGDTFTLDDWAIQNHGVGYYAFQVKALSKDITVACNGDWSEMSPLYNLTELVDNVDTQLNDIVQGSQQMEAEEIREAVQSMDTTELKSAMLADRQETGVMAAIAALEEVVGGAAPVEVTQEAAAFDAGKISIVGANLNNAESASEPIKLVIDKPEQDHVLEEVYDNSVAVKFSMDLENVADTENLEVPVKITLPIPATINPEFLVILHYHVDGTVEEIGLPHIFKENQQYYASFVLTSFSDFVITQYKQECTEHTFGDWTVTQAATCEGAGTKERTCTNCGESETETIPATGHTEVTDAAVAPTCTAEGKTEGKHCSVCNAVLTAQETVPATGHTEVTDAAVAPTCTAEGKTEGKHCSVCNTVLTAQETVPATGHSWDQGIITTQPTEDTEGVRTYTCTACGETKTEAVPKLDHVHDYDSVVTAPTCTEGGYTTHTCACGDSYTDSEVPATGHTEVADAAVAPTCTAEGKTEGKHCSVCNTVLTAQETVPATGHSWDSGVVTTQPTATEPGVKTYTCTVCGETKTEAIPATGETFILGDANGDGRVNFKDAILVLQFASGRVTEENLNVTAADANGDGRHNFKDAIQMLKIASGRA